MSPSLLKFQIKLHLWINLKISLFTVAYLQRFNRQAPLHLQTS